MINGNAPMGIGDGGMYSAARAGSQAGAVKGGGGLACLEEVGSDDVSPSDMKSGELMDADLAHQDRRWPRTSDIMEAVHHSQAGESPLQHGLVPALAGRCKQRLRRDR